MSAITELEAHEAVYQRFKSQWDTLQPSVPYCFANEKFTELQDGTTSWAIVELRGTDSVQHTLGQAGSREWLRQANVWVRLFTPLNGGVGPAMALVDSVRQVFEGADYGGVHSSGGARVVPVGSDGRWYEVVVISPVTYYETH